MISAKCPSCVAFTINVQNMRSILNFEVGGGAKQFKDTFFMSLNEHFLEEDELILFFVNSCGASAPSALGSCVSIQLQKIDDKVSTIC